MAGADSLGSLLSDLGVEAAVFSRPKSLVDMKNTPQAKSGQGAMSAARTGTTMPAMSASGQRPATTPAGHRDAFSDMGHGVQLGGSTTRSTSAASLASQ